MKKNQNPSLAKYTILDEITTEPYKLQETQNQTEVDQQSQKEENIIDVINKASTQELLDIAKNEEFLQHQYVRKAITKRAEQPINPMVYDNSTGKLSKPDNFIDPSSKEYKQEEIDKQEILSLIKKNIIKQLENNGSQYIISEQKKNLLNNINKANTQELLDIVKNQYAPLDDPNIRKAIRKRAEQPINPMVYDNSTGKLSKPDNFIDPSSKEYKQEEIDKQEILSLIKKNIIKQLENNGSQYIISEQKKNLLNNINKANTQELLDIVKNQYTPLDDPNIRKAITKRARRGITGKLSPAFISIFDKDYGAKAKMKQEILKIVNNFNLDTKNRGNQEVIGENEVYAPHGHKINTKQQNEIKLNTKIAKENLQLQQQRTSTDYNKKMLQTPKKVKQNNNLTKY